jgi:hypothetical protein
MGVSPHNIETAIRESVPSTIGFPHTENIRLADWILSGSGAAILHGQLIAAGANIVGVKALETGTADILGICWDAAATTTDGIKFVGGLPADFNEDRDELWLSVWVRKHDTTGSATENADLALTATLKHFCSGSAEATAETAVSETLAAKSALTTYAAFVRYDFCWSGQGLKANGAFEIELAPQEAVGTALEIHMLPNSQLRYNRHACIRDLTQRQAVPTAAMLA